jgi:hypothetical protein
MSTEPKTACHDESYRQMIDDVVIDELPAQKWEKLRQHLQTCPSCRARYNKAVLAERMLHGGPQAAHRPSPAEFDRIAQAVLAHSDGAPASVWARALKWFAPTQRWATGLVAAAAAVALIPILSHLNAPKAIDEDGFQSRGGNKGGVELFANHPQLKPIERAAGLRAFCLTGDKVQALDPTGTSTPRCDRKGQLKLAVSNPGKYNKVFLVGLDADHELKWYAPRPPETESVAAPLGTETVDVPVGATVRLVVNHQAGPVRIYALFSDKTIKATEVEAASQELKKRAVKPADKEAEALPIKRSDVLQRSLLIDVQP